jgi:hypothetical protein
MDTASMAPILGGGLINSAASAAGPAFSLGGGPGNVTLVSAVLGLSGVPASVTVGLQVLLGGVWTTVGACEEQTSPGLATAVIAAQQFGGDLGHLARIAWLLDEHTSVTAAITAIRT